MQVDFTNLLKAHPPLTALLARDADDDQPLINWVTRPDKSRLPALTLETVSTIPEVDQSGRGEMEPTRVQIDIWSDSYGKGRAIYRVLIDLLFPHGNFVSHEKGATRFERFILDGDRDLPVTDLDGGQRVFHIAVDFIIWHKPIA